MGDTSVPDVIDYLFNGITALPACASPVVVFDGYPTSEPQRYVVVGGIGDAAVANPQEVWADIGAHERDEDYLVLCRVSSAVGSTSQKEARDGAYSLYKAIAAWVRSDDQLGGLVGPWPVEVAESQLAQTDAEAAPAGRTALLDFYIRVRNRI